MKRILIALVTTTAAAGMWVLPSGSRHLTSPAASHSSKTDMVYVAGGRFVMGSASGHSDEIPVHPVTLSSFYMDRHEVTNRQFDEFVRATGHVTSAERDGFSWCYIEGSDDFKQIEGADWRHPEGPQSSIAVRMDHPVVCVSWCDALAYTRWAGKLLPTEAEWEYAARSGGSRQVTARPRCSTGMCPVAGTSDPLVQKSSAIPATRPSNCCRLKNGRPVQGDVSGSDDAEMVVEANYWQGRSPGVNLLTDGYFYTSPVGHFKANELGLSDMIGNVWEWCADYYAADFYSRSPELNPQGPMQGDNHVARGGSWFCSESYCSAYNSHYRGNSPPDHAFNNVGFRCAADAP